jgi:phosphoserine phosphatase RsbU/P
VRRPCVRDRLRIGRVRQTSPASKRSRRAERFPGERALKDRALDIASEGVTIVDLRPPHQPIIYVNEGFERLTGYSAQEVLGTNCRLLQGPETDPETCEEIRRAIRERRECRVEILNYRKDGEPFWNRLSLTPVQDANGEITHYIGVQSDVSDRRGAEDALREANRELRLANERTRRSLDAAARIQQSLLPQDLPVLPGARFAFGFRPSETLAGDVLNIVPLDGHHVGLYVIDVSGHGVPAALLSVTLSHWLQPSRRGSLLLTPDGAEPGRPWITPPRQVADRLAQQFPFDLRTGQYFTMIYAVLNTARRQLRFVCAGHPAPILVPAAGPPRVLEASGLPIGIGPETAYEDQLVDLVAGDRLLLYSDGITDAENPEGREFGLDGLLRGAHETRTLPLDEAVARLVRRVEEWCDAAGPRDDLSLVALEIDRDS